MRRKSVGRKRNPEAKFEQRGVAEGRRGKGIKRSTSPRKDCPCMLGVRQGSRPMIRTEGSVVGSGEEVNEQNAVEGSVFRCLFLFSPWKCPCYLYLVIWPLLNRSNKPTWNRRSNRILLCLCWGLHLISDEKGRLVTRNLEKSDGWEQQLKSWE